MPITATPFKKTLKWDIGHAVDGTTDTDLLVPRIVDRAQPVNLEELVYNAIDTGRIAGLKPSAAGAIADALCEQIGSTLMSGRGVKFGDYFYVRNYLTGTVAGLKAPLTEENKLSTRLIAGESLKIDKGNFSLSYASAQPRPEISEVLADTLDAVNNEIVKTKAFYVIGRNFTWAAGSTAKLSWGEGDDATSVNITPTMTGPEQLKFAWPAALADATVGTKLTLAFAFAVEDSEAVMPLVYDKLTLVAAP